MDGVRGYRGWRWIFIIEGLITVAFGLFFLFTFPSFPEEAKWLTPEEKTYVKARLRADQGDNGADRKMKWADVVAVMSDYKIWLGGFMYFGMIVPAYGNATSPLTNSSHVLTGGFQDMPTLRRPSWEPTSTAPSRRNCTRSRPGPLPLCFPWSWR